MQTLNTYDKYIDTFASIMIMTSWGTAIFQYIRIPLTIAREIVIRRNCRRKSTRNPKSMWITSIVKILNDFLTDAIHKTQVLVPDTSCMGLLDLDPLWNVKIVDNIPHSIAFRCNEKWLGWIQGLDFAFGNWLYLRPELELTQFSELHNSFCKVKVYRESNWPVAYGSPMRMRVSL